MGISLYVYIASTMQKNAWHFLVYSSSSTLEKDQAPPNILLYRLNFGYGPPIYSYRDGNCLICWLTSRDKFGKNISSPHHHLYRLWNWSCIAQNCFLPPFL